MTSAARIGITALAVVAVAACTFNPKQVTDEERNARVQALKTLFTDQEPVSGPLSMSAAMARAIKYNVDERVKLMEIALARTDIDVARMDMLPRLVASAGYSKRSNESASESESILTGQQSLEPSRSSERQQTLADAVFVWNLLDFGVSYVTAQQRADQVLIYDQRRRKAVQNIVTDVRRSYWKALSAQRLGPELDKLIADVEAAVADSQGLAKRGLQSKADAARYQESLLVSLRQLWRIRSDMQEARIQLATLMNLSPGTEFTLEPGKEDLLLPEVKETPQALENKALVNRPELREEDYQRRIHQLDVKKAMLRMFPGIEIELGAHYDSNDFLVNNSWNALGLRLTWNIFNVFAGPTFRREAEANIDLDNMRRMAQSMAILTQLHVAFQTYQLAMVNYQLANELTAVSDRISDQLGRQREAGGSAPLEVVRARARAIVAQLQRDQAFAELQNSVGRIESSIGEDPLPKEVAGHDLDSLSRAIAAHQTRLGASLARKTEPGSDPMSAPVATGDTPVAPAEAGDTSGQPMEPPHTSEAAPGIPVLDPEQATALATQLF